ncbi:unnamed protein product [Prunus armeniaca]
MMVATTRGGTSKWRIRGLGRSSSQPQPLTLPSNIKGSAPIGPNQMAQLSQPIPASIRHRGRQKPPRNRAVWIVFDGISQSSFGPLRPPFHASESVLGPRFRPLPATFWGRSKN